jgi:hypothetical protein
MCGALQTFSHKIYPPLILADIDTFVGTGLSATYWRDTKVSCMLVGAHNLIAGSATEIAMPKQTAIHSFLDRQELSEVVRCGHTTWIEEILILTQTSTLQVIWLTDGRYKIRSDLCHIDRQGTHNAKL